MYCIDLAAELNGKYKYWWDKHHTTRIGSKVVAETVINDLINKARSYDEGREGA